MRKVLCFLRKLVRATVPRLAVHAYLQAKEKEVSYRDTAWRMHMDAGSMGQSPVPPWREP